MTPQSTQPTETEQVLEFRLGERIIIFDSAIFDSDSSVGWVVDSVHEVSDIVPEGIDESPIDQEHVRGLIERESNFVIGIHPRTVNGELDGADLGAAEHR